jgi:molybdopterin-guanine dinucleotide biosynthesis protein MobB
MWRLHVIGRKNHGKTQLVVELVQTLSARQLRVGTIKHTHHHHELDTPGKDSHRHRLAGATAVGILSQSMSAVFWPAEHLPDNTDRYAALAPAFATCDWVVVEGDIHAAAPRIEVWRADLGSPPLAAEDPSILAVVSDDALQLSVPILPRRDVGALVDWLLQRVPAPAP